MALLSGHGAGLATSGLPSCTTPFPPSLPTTRWRLSTRTGGTAIPAPWSSCRKSIPARPRTASW
eukprot:5411209-Pyramimonas_sp.AAC.1